MKIIILLVFALLAVTFIADFLKKRAARTTSQPTAPRMPTANEQPPTETGKLRVAEIVHALKKPVDEKPAGEGDSGESPEAEPTELPDPFEGNPKQ